jgi:TatD DNase family protein
MHAFDGKASLARVASTEHGYYFSIPTSVVRSAQKRKLVKAVDIERILVETDSPVLGPDRESRNEPMNVWVALREVALILRREEEEMREILLENTLRLYPGIRTK